MFPATTCWILMREFPCAVTNEVGSFPPVAKLFNAYFLMLPGATEQELMTRNAQYGTLQLTQARTPSAVSSDL
jgi:hypothetical protein